MVKLTVSVTNLGDAIAPDVYAAAPASGFVQYGSQIEEGSFDSGGSNGRYSFGQ